MKNFHQKPIPDELFKPIGWKNIKAKTIDEPLVCLNDFLLVDPIYDKRYKHGCSQVLARENVALNLVKVNNLLKKYYKIQIIILDCLRPPMLQKEVFSTIENQMQKIYINKKIARKKTLEFVSPPIAIAPHNSGGAVDVCLANLEGNKLYVGSKFDEMSEKSYPRYYENAKTEKHKNYRNYRRILYWAMNAYDFEIYYNEWWHFSYKDRHWFAIKKQKNPNYSSTIYGPVIKQNLKI